MESQETGKELPPVVEEKKDDAMSSESEHFHSEGVDNEKTRKIKKEESEANTADVSYESSNTSLQTLNTKGEEPMCPVYLDVVGKTNGTTAVVEQNQKTFFEYLEKQLSDTPEMLFEGNTNVLSTVIDKLILLCTKEIPELQKKSVSMLYALIKKDYVFNKSSVLNTQSHIISSIFNLHFKMCSKELENVDAAIFKTIKDIGDLAQSDMETCEKVPLQVDQTSEKKQWESSVAERRELFFQQVIEQVEPLNKEARSVLKGLEQLCSHWNLCDDSRMTLLKEKVTKSVEQEDHCFLLQREALVKATEWISDARDFTNNLMAEKSNVETLQNQFKEIEKANEDFVAILKRMKEEKPTIKMSLEKFTQPLVLMREALALRKSYSTSGFGTVTVEQINSFVGEEEEVVRVNCKEQKRESDEATDLLGEAQFLLSVYQDAEKEFMKRIEEVRDKEKNKTRINENDIFYKYEKLLPKITNVINSILEVQIQLEEVERTGGEEEQMKPEQIIRVGMWCVEAMEVTEYPITCIDEMQHEIGIASDLFKQYGAVEKMMLIIKNVMAEKKVDEVTFGKLYGRFVEEKNWRNVITQKLEEMQEIYSQHCEMRKDEMVWNNLLDHLREAVTNSDAEMVETVVDKVNEFNERKNLKYRSNLHKNVLSVFIKKVRVLKMEKGGKKFKKQIEDIEEVLQKICGDYERNLLKEQIDKLDEKINAILQELIELRSMEERNEADDIVLEKYLSIANKSIETPSFHILWFDTIFQKQKERKKYMEAGVAAVHILHYIYKILVEPSGVLLKEKYLKEINEECLVDSVGVVQEKSANNITYDKFLVEVNNAIEMFERSKSLRFAIAVCNFIIPFLANNHEFKLLSEKHKKIHDFYVEMRTLIVFPTYFYYVKFIGSAFDFPESKPTTPALMESKGNEFNTIIKAVEKVETRYKGEYVYRSQLKLGEFAEYLVNMYKKVQAEVVRQNLYDKNIEDYRTKNAVITVIGVVLYNPMGSKMEEAKQKTFVNEIPIVKGDELSKDQVIITTKRSLPSMMERESVVEITNATLSPLQTACGDIEKQIQMIDAEIDKIENNDNVGVSNIHKLLNGVLYAKVNGGLELLVTKFMTVEKIKASKANEVEDLYEIMGRVMALCKKGIMIAKNRMKESDSSIQNIIETSYLLAEKMMKDVEVFLKEQKILPSD
ncbi:DNA double-strand break repair Rad50 ATPase, putative [Entamoeba invadens IP1]|uniref:DNA double-strand break repair Rad50 ATPase, putative n=1 Tax=Entamoeba invadens IP1 TaxID=370355 RepID=A0A0A1TY15_ENTIV|nr:DNA double-strand break repair Rad50 ATPase, putative [Entamoeba invadens IP1]ELP86293.1 DNA double-strand break repair Rad50 ATPase, putative [Entamoeba invadens IP1]|eukprot:XP_004185639.1 DNA double-strand break repair Rad50 ATPase, putative [Entamoeba invadens IP1]